MWLKNLDLHKHILQAWNYYNLLMETRNKCIANFFHKPQKSQYLKWHVWTQVNGKTYIW